jgi:hypothetical protein
VADVLIWAQDLLAGFLSAAMITYVAVLMHRVWICRVKGCWRGQYRISRKVDGYVCEQHWKEEQP